MTTDLSSKELLAISFYVNKYRPGLNFECELSLVLKIRKRIMKMQEEGASDEEITKMIDAMRGV